MVDVSTKGQLVVLEVGGCKELLTLYQVDVLLRELKWASTHASAVRWYLATVQVDGVLPDGAMKPDDLSVERLRAMASRLA